jgi:hypothetical protein
LCALIYDSPSFILPSFFAQLPRFSSQRSFVSAWSFSRSPSRYFLAHYISDAEGYIYIYKFLRRSYTFVFSRRSDSSFLAI